MKHISKPTFK
uniref:Uncharacterized protein n=1 Tax=Lepeophtheirus salmonis TaxID=72036 RepID=A0A0K2T161_LEPSM